jgi:hypothetical protein
MFINHNVMYEITLNNIGLKIIYAKVYYQVRIYLFQVHKISPATARRFRRCIFNGD